MQGNNTQCNGTKTNDDSTANDSCAPDGKRLLIANTLLAGMLGIALLLPITGYSQTLDEAVSQQLGADVDGNPCAILLGDQGTLNDLEGQLRDSICSRFVPSAGDTPSSATGGGAGTAITLTDIVKERMVKQEDTEEQQVGKRLSLFITGGYERLDRDTTEFEDGYDSDIGRLIVGADIQITSHALAGLAFDASRQNGNFNGGGDFDITSYGIIGYGSLLPTDNVFVQMYGGLSTESTDRNRTASFTELNDAGDVNFSTSGNPSSDFDTDQYSAGILIGYDHPIGSVTIGPRAGLDWNKSDFDTYNEKDDSGLALTFHNDEVTSLQSAIGLQGSTAISKAFGVVVPQASVYWKHEFDQDQRDVDVSFVEDKRSKQFSYETERPDRDFFEFNVGLSLVLSHGFQTFMNFRALSGHDYYDNYAGTMGMRIEM